MTYRYNIMIKYNQAVKSQFHRGWMIGPAEGNWIMTS